MTQQTRARWLVLAASALWSIACCGEASAQSSRDKVSFRSIRVGYPPGPHTASPEEAMGQRPPSFKAGAWMPIIVDVQNTGKYDPAVDGPAFVSVEVPDSDDTLNSFTAPLPPFDDGGSSSVILYTRPGSRYSDITVRVQAKGRELCKDQRSYSGLDANQLLYLALGSRLPGLKVPGLSSEQPGVVQQNLQRAEVGMITRVLDLPTLWFGYGSADVVILATSDRDFLTAFVSDQSGRKAALAEWVRRGGKLVVCAGRNRDQFAGSPELQALVPMTIEGPYVVPSAQIRWEGGSQAEEPLTNSDDKPIEFTRLRARTDRAARVLVDGPSGVADASPLIVQGPYGLGCVTLVAFDPDARPVRGWNGEALFWEQLLRASGPRPASGNQANQFGGFGRYGGDESDEMLQALVNRLDQFEGVPVISFGWVALFILLYILVVGPLDYLFLKKVVKRLELTWITFPTVVLAVSAAAYFTAYHLKGSDLRVNRVDIVDYDFQSKQAYGRSFFSVFSPRIQKYTIGVAPSEGWAAAPDDPAAAPTTVVSWFGAPKMGRQSFFRHSYDYARQAEGLISVPINVWSTKGFQAWWVAPFEKDVPPFVSGITHPPTGNDTITGAVTSNLPVDLEDAILIYKGAVSNLGTMLPGVAKVVSAGQPVDFSQWYSGAESAPPEQLEVRPTLPGQAGVNGIAARLEMNLLFHEASRSIQNVNNGAMRDLDQSWRVNKAGRDEAILVARLKQAKGTAEGVNASPENPTRLWLGKLPSDRKANGQAEDRPEIQGTMRQDVYVRVFIPIAPVGTK